MKRFLFATVFGFAALAGGALSAASIDINAREYVLIDYQTGAVLGAKDADKPMPPSSMSKLMTAYMAFEALKAGRVSLDDELTVSRNAWQLGGAASGPSRSR